MHVFVVQIKKEWQIGYYNPLTETVTAFAIGQEMTINPDAKMVPNSKVLELNVEDISLNLDEALARAEKLRETKYASHLTKKQVILI